MKRRLAVLALFILSIVLIQSLMAYRKAEKAFGDILSELGIERYKAEEYMRTGFLLGRLSGPKAIYAAHSWDAGKRKEALREVSELVKGYMNSEAFQQVYVKQELAKQMTPDDYEELKIQVDASKELIAVLEKQLKEYGGDEKQLGEVERSNLQWYRTSKQKLDAYELLKSGKPQPGWRTVQGPFIAQRLQEFIAFSQTIDFDARLIPRNGKMVFEKEEYEKKSGDWKKCYRAGRELMDEARKICTEWIAELKTNQN